MPDHLLYMCCTLLRSVAATRKIHPYQQVFRERNGTENEERCSQSKEDKKMMNATELNLNEMEMINGGGAAKNFVRIFGAIATPLAGAVGGPLCGLAVAGIMAVAGAAAEIGDKS